MSDAIGGRGPAEFPLPENFIDDPILIVNFIELVLLFVLLFFFFHNIFNWELNLKQLIFFSHFSADKATIKSTIPLILILFG
jgi:hypothetical protein